MSAHTKFPIGNEPRIREYVPGNLLSTDSFYQGELVRVVNVKSDMREVIAADGRRGWIPIDCLKADASLYLLPEFTPAVTLSLFNQG